MAAGAFSRCLATGALPSNGALATVTEVWPNAEAGSGRPDLARVGFAREPSRAVVAPRLLRIRAAAACRFRGARADPDSSVSPPWSPRGPSSGTCPGRRRPGWRGKHGFEPGVRFEPAPWDLHLAQEGLPCPNSPSSYFILFYFGGLLRPHPAVFRAYALRNCSWQVPGILGDAEDRTQVTHVQGKR